MDHHQPQPLPVREASQAAPQEATALRVVGSHAQICSRCGSLDETRTKTPGSLAIEILLWLCFLVPGIIYTLWRHSRKHTICARCSSAELVEAGTPIGRQLIRQYHPDASILEWGGGGMVATTRRAIDAVVRWVLYAIGALIAIGAVLAWLSP